MIDNRVIRSLLASLILFAVKCPPAECHETDNNPDGSTGCSSVRQNPRCWRYCSGSEGAWCYTSRGCGSSTESCAVLTTCADISCDGAASGCVQSCESFKPVLEDTSENAFQLLISGAIHSFPLGSTGCSTKWTIFRSWCWRFCSGSSGSWCYTGTDCYWDNEICATKTSCAGVGCDGADPGCVDQCPYIPRTKSTSPTPTSTSTEPTRNITLSEDKDSVVEDNGINLQPSCKDSEYFANCKLVVRAKYCTNKYYARFCCKSCTLAGQLPTIGPNLHESNQRLTSPSGISRQPTPNTTVTGNSESFITQNNSISTNPNKPKDISTSVIKQGDLPPNCTDNPKYANCKLIVKSRFCNNKYYTKFCCKSCTLAGQLSPVRPNLPKPTQSPSKEPTTTLEPKPTISSEPAHMTIKCLHFSNNKINRTLSDSKPISWFSMESSFDSRDTPSDAKIRAHYKETTFYSRAPIELRESSNSPKCSEFDSTAFEIVEQQRKELHDQIGRHLEEINYERPRSSDPNNPVVEFYRRRIASSPEIFRVEYLRAEFHPFHLNLQNLTDLYNITSEWMGDNLHSQEEDVPLSLSPMVLSGPTELYNFVPGHPSVKRNSSLPFERSINDWQTVEAGMAEFLGQGEERSVDWVVGLYYDTEFGGRPTHFVYEAIFRNNNTSIVNRIMGSSRNQPMEAFL